MTDIPHDHLGHPDLQALVRQCGGELDATAISDRGLFRLLAENLSPGVFRFCNTICQEETLQPPSPRHRKCCIPS